MNDSNGKCGEHCGHGFGCHKSFFFVRWIFGLIILLMVFCVGVAVGKFAGEVDRYGEHYGMMQYGRYNSGYGYGPGMMQGWVFQTPTGTQTTVSAAKTTVK